MKKVSKRKCKHGMSRSVEYRTWVDMKQRCYNPKHKKYPLYGAKGIILCNKWLDSFESFYQDMGDRPGKGYSIDRINGKGNYEPSNCRWATIYEQNRNLSKRKNSTSKYKNVSKCSKSGKWLAWIYRSGYNRFVGTYLTEEEAYAAYLKKEEDWVAEHGVEEEF